MTNTCEGCKFFVKIVGHPWNKKDTFTHGGISETKCDGCSCFSDEKIIVLFDKPSIGCEMYTEDIMNVRK